MFGRIKTQRDFRDLSRNLRARTPSVSRSAWFYTRKEVGILYPPILSTRGTFWIFSVTREISRTDIAGKSCRGRSLGRLHEMN
jgi:hypothetical protein